MEKTIKTYHELIQLPEFIDRYKYLKLGGMVGIETFGYDRYINQLLYSCDEWKRTRREIIIRDNGCDLGCADRPISGLILVHHLNPITKEQIIRRDPIIFDPENLISTTKGTHNAIHYGDESLLCIGPTIRTPNDTCPWKHREGGKNG